MTRDIHRAALPPGYYLELVEEARRCLFEGLARFELAGMCLALKSEIPVFGNILGLGKTLLLGGSAPLLPADARRALPKSAVGPTENLHLSAKDLMNRRHHHHL